jgi:tRNA(Ile)-lysidine synthase
MDLLKFQSALTKDLKLTRENPILTGVSGGADSLCLAEALIQCGFPLVIAHFDHQLRTKSSQDARLVEEYANSRKTQFLLDRGDVRGYCQEHSLSIEEGARELRYRFLFEQARKAGVQAVATGHTEDDQAETVVMHFLRGSGVSGLKGMKPRTILSRFDSEIPLVRPLLRTTRQETEQFCEQNAIAFIHDETNADISYFRNRLRLEVMPLMETYQPGIRDRLGRTSRVMVEVEDLLTNLAEAALDRVTVNEGSGYFTLSLTAMQAEHLAIQRELLRKVIHKLREDNRDVDFGAIERILSLIHDCPSGKKVDLLDGIEAVLSQGELILKDKEIEVFQPDQLWMPAGSSQIVQRDDRGFGIGNIQIEFQNRLNNKESTLPLDLMDPFLAVLDLDILKLPLILRTREEGDRIQPYGLKGRSQKLSDFWINEGLPQDARKNWPLFCDQAGIFWIPGFRIMHPYRVTDTTMNILEIRVTKTRR